MPLKLSQFTLFVSDYPQPGSYLAFNTRTQALVALNKRLKSVLDALPASENGSSDGERKYLTILTDMGILVEEKVDETALLQYWFERMKYEDDTFMSTVVTTYDCNFACPYCFEEGVKQPKYLNQETADQIMVWIEKKITEKAFPKLRFAFYGGEPLLNRPLVEYMAKELYGWSKEHGVEFTFTMVTNGSLLTPSTIEKLAAFGLTDVRVTLDGDRPVHNQKRPLKRGKGSFDLIIRNIRSVADQIKVNLQGNFDRHDWQSMTRLLDYLEGEGLSKKIAGISFAPIIGRLGGEDGSTPDFTACTSYIEANLSEAKFALQQELVNRRLQPHPIMGVNLCALYKHNNMFIIDPDGLLYKCPSFLGYPDFSIGSIFEKDLNYLNVEFMTLDVWRKCLNCVWVPMCGGGCRLSAYLRTGDYRQLACDRAYLDKMGPELLKLEYERSHQKK